MNGSSAIDNLIVKSRSNDNDVKTDAIAKLQLELEGNAEITDVEALTAALKTCLRISNQHLSTATLSTIQAFIPRISASSGTLPLSSPPDSRVVSNLRHALLAFLPSGGVIDRLGEARETARAIARETLVVLGTHALKSSGTSGSIIRTKDQKLETPFVLFEKFLKEIGLGSKVWRVREQSILAIVQLRGVNPQFPLRPFLSPIVEALEDSDGSVRDCARQSVVTLFSGPLVSDSARADLKNEMVKKNVRKSIVDSILSGLIGSSHSVSSMSVKSNGSQSQGEHSGSEGDKAAPRSNVNRSVSATHIRKVSRELPRSHSQSTGVFENAQIESAIAPATAPTVVAPVFIASARDLENEFAKMIPHFEGKETEHNWSSREQDVLNIRGIIKGDAHVRYQDAFISGLKSGALERTFKTVRKIWRVCDVAIESSFSQYRAQLASLRTTVAVNTCLLYSELAAELGPLLDPFVDILLQQLLRMAGFTKKIVAQQSQSSVTAIITHTSCQSRIILPQLLSFSQEKTAQARQYVLGHISVFLDVHVFESKSAIESSGALEILEKILRKGLVDPTPGVKSKAREAFWTFQKTWPSHALPIMESLDAVARKQLEKANPTPGATPVVSQMNTPVAKKSSVAAAIAASRAKAKAIATAPPTLRHAATSGATAAAAASRLSSPPLGPQSMIRSVSARPSPTSSSFNRRSVSPAMPHSTSSLPSRPGSASSSRPGRGSPKSRAGSLSPSPPSSPTAELTMRRRTMSPLIAHSPPSRSPPASLAKLPRALSPPNFTSSLSLLRPPNDPPHSSLFRHFTHANLPRDSLAMLGKDVDDSLLMAIQNPLPDDSDDSDDDNGFGAVSFSSLSDIQQHPPSLSTPRSISQSSAPTTLYPGDSMSQSASQVLSFPQQHTPTQDLMEDALRAAAEQAESSAERLTELLEPDSHHLSPIPPSLLVSSSGSEVSSSTARVPSTPTNRPHSKNVFKQLALFQNSPAVKGSPSVMDRLYENKHQTGWWLKRKSLLDAGTPLKTDRSNQNEELRGYIKELQAETASVRTLQKLILLCNTHPAPTPDAPPSREPLSPLQAKGTHGQEADLWQGGRTFDALIKPLLKLLRTTKDEETIEYGLCVVWEMVEHQTAFLDEAEIFSLLFNARYANTHPILEATSTVRDALVSRQEPVYGLKTLHACLLEFLSEPLPSSPSAPQIRTSSHAFGIIGIGKLIMRLPAEILEDELPILRNTLTSVMDAKDPSQTTVREAAYACIVAAQAILRDETRTFALLGGLELSKKNLLTYYFDKHGARGVVDGVAGSPTKTGADAQNGDGQGDEKVVRELLRLDIRISTPVKSRQS